MSQEDAVERERREVMELLEKPLTPDPPATAKGNRISFQPPSVRTTSDVSPGPLPARHGSIAGIGVGVTPPSTRRSDALGVSEPASSRLRLSLSAASSPARSQAGSEGAPSASSGDLRRAPAQFNMSPSDVDQGLPAYVTRPQLQPQERSPSKAIQGRNATATLMGRFESRSFNGASKGRDDTRRRSQRRLSLDSSTVPSGHSLFPLSTQWMKTDPFNVAARSETSVTERGQVIDKSIAHQYLSDEALPQSSGSLARLARPGSRQGSDSDGTCFPEEGRLEIDLCNGVSNALETSDEENGTTSSEDDASRGVQGKSSKRGRNKPLDNCSPTQGNGPSSSNSKAPQSQLEAAEEERQMVESGVAESGSEVFTQKSRKLEVHPQTSFDHVESALNTPFGSDDEAELSDIKKAQKLDILMSSIDSSIPNRTIRTIIRGDYKSILEGEDGTRRRQRKYLVATDLSEESVYALEWTIGTILRDGDTLFAVCALHEEASVNPSIQTGDGRAVPDITSIVGSQTAEATSRNLHHDTSTMFSRTVLHLLGHGADNRPRSADSQGMSNAELDRVHTVETISQTCVRLLRKTMLQVRIAVEVIHCRSQKHMITEAIDGLEPTLVIVGARGASALKGVLLGSFSNYLVSKSSVPVMVARKKLKAQTKKKTNVRLSNNLNTPKRLAMAKVD